MPSTVERGELVTDEQRRGGGHGVERMAVFIFIGYLTMGRSFAYLRPVGGIPLFIGEIALLVMLFRRPVLQQLLDALATRGRLTPVALATYAFVGYGSFTVLRGVATGHPVAAALENFAFNYYPLFFFAGLALRPSFGPATLVRILAVVNATYGSAYILLSLSTVAVQVPLSPAVPLFGQPAGSAIAILGLMCFGGRASAVHALMLANGFVLLAMQVRAEWLGFLVGCLVWVVLRQQTTALVQRLSRVVVTWSFVAVIVVGLAVSGASIRSPAGRGGAIEANEIAARALSAFSPDAAAERSVHASSYAGTVSWRTYWWGEIWDSVNTSVPSAALGHGYGYPLWDLAPYLRGTEIRTPHSAFFYALGYSGWIGVLLFAVLCAAIARCVLRHGRDLRGGASPEATFGVVLCCVGFTVGLFGNFFEAPFGAIPYFLALGLCCRTTVDRDGPARPQRRGEEV